MNFDATYYHALTPIALSFRLVAGTVLAAAVIWHWCRGSWLGVAQGPRKAWDVWKNALLALLVFTLVYVPMPNPGRYLGFRDDDVDLQQLHYHQSTVAIFALERISYGVDSLIKNVLFWDVTSQALAMQESAFIDGPSGSIRTSRQPNNAEIVYGFVVLRGQFLLRYLKALWDHADLRPEGAAPQTSGNALLQVWDLFKNLTGEQKAQYLVQQLTALFFSAGALLALGVSFLLMTLIAYVILGIAGLIKFAAVYVMGVALFILPFAYFIKGRQALVAGANLLVVYLFLKGAVMLVLWIGFYLLEGVVVQGYLEVINIDPDIAEIVRQFEPGFLYTDAGSEILFSTEHTAHAAAGFQTLQQLVLSMIVLLLGTVYILFKLPGFLAGVLGVSPSGEDLFSSSLFLGGSLVTLGASVKARLAATAAKKAGNAIHPHEP